ncbi:Thyrotropin-releasing hormone receptor [Nymphon striatum]|nr:Thyrotropin-releasing hormone receptor [Nymphon striatum]
MTTLGPLTMLNETTLTNFTTECFNQTMFNSTNSSLSCNDTSNGTNLLDLQYYSHTYRLIGTLFLLPIFIVGVVGNVMVVTVVARTRSMRSPTNCYLVSLAIADILVLISSVPNEILSLYLLGDHWIFGQVGCSSFIFLQYLGINASSLSITAFTIERYIAICHPMKAHAICTISRAIKIICAVWLFGFSYCLAWLFMVRTEPLHYKEYPDLETCNFRFPREVYVTIFFTDILLFYCIPLLLCVILYGMIARMLLTCDIPKTFGNKSNGHHADSKKSKSGANPKVQVIKMLAVIVAVFATFWMPYRVLLVYNSLAKERYMNLWFLMFCKTMVYINSAINPVLYNAMSMKFRRAFKRVLSCGSQEQISSAYRDGGHVTYKGSPTIRTGTRMETSLIHVEHSAT